MRIITIDLISTIIATTRTIIWDTAPSIVSRVTKLPAFVKHVLFPIASTCCLSLLSLSLSLSLGVGSVHLLFVRCFQYSLVIIKTLLFTAHKALQYHYIIIIVVDVVVVVVAVTMLHSTT
jgi:hypothetical protein